MCSVPHFVARKRHYHLWAETYASSTHVAYAQCQQTEQASKSSTQDVVIRRNLRGHCDWQIRVAQLALHTCVCCVWVCVWECVLPLENIWQADCQLRVTPRWQMKWHLAVQFWHRFNMQHTETRQARDSWLVPRAWCVVSGWECVQSKADVEHFKLKLLNC